MQNQIYSANCFTFKTYSHRGGFRLSNQVPLLKPKPYKYLTQDTSNSVSFQKKKIIMYNTKI